MCVCILRVHNCSVFHSFFAEKGLRIRATAQSSPTPYCLAHQQVCHLRPRWPHKNRLYNVCGCKYVHACICTKFTSCTCVACSMLYVVCCTRVFCNAQAVKTLFYTRWYGLYIYLYYACSCTCIDNHTYCHLCPYSYLHPQTITFLFNVPYTVHDTENLTFSEEFRSCSVQTPVDSCAERRGSSARVPRIFRADRHGSSVWIRVENGRNQKANFVRNNAEGWRNTPQRSFE